MGMIVQLKFNYKFGIVMYNKFNKVCVRYSAHQQYTANVKRQRPQHSQRLSSKLARLIYQRDGKWPAAAWCGV